MSFQGKIGISENLYNYALDGFLILEGTPVEISGDAISKGDSFMLHNKLYVHLENLHNSVNQYFTSDPYMI